MKFTYALAALTAITLNANAATIFDTLAGNDDQAAFTAGGTVATGAGQTFRTGTLGTENLLSTITMANRTGASGTIASAAYLAVYENNAADGQTWTPGTLVGVSSNFQDMTVLSTNSVWQFNNFTLNDNTNYLITFTSDAAGQTTVSTGVRVTLNSGSTDQSAFANGSASFGGAHTLATKIDTVPEPSSTALLGLGGLALILRRRK